MEKVYYFDNAATTFPKHENVYKAMDEANRDYAVNAGRGAYALARKASEVISETRQQIMELTETENVAEVVFTASATLACNEIFGGIDWKKKTDCVCFRHLNITQLCGVYFYTRRGMVF